MKGNKIASICAYVSLAISVVIILLWCCNVGGFTVVSLDSFVGVIVALLAIVVTLAIAWQIYNAVELKKKVEELFLIKDQYKEQQHSLEQIAYRFHHHIGHIMGSANPDRIESFRFLMFSLMNTLQLDQPINVDQLLKRMQRTVKGEQAEVHYEAEYYDSVMDYDQTIRALANYSLIKSRYESIFNQFMAKVKRYEE